MVPVTRWEVDGQMFVDEAEARAVHEQQGGVIRRRVVDVPAVYKLWNPSTKTYLDGTFTDAAMARTKCRGCEIRLVPAESPPV